MLLSCFCRPRDLSSPLFYAGVRHIKCKCFSGVTSVFSSYTVSEEQQDLSARGQCKSCDGNLMDFFHNRKQSLSETSHWNIGTVTGPQTS